MPDHECNGFVSKRTRQSPYHTQMKITLPTIMAFATLLCGCSCSVTGSRPTAQITAVEIVDFGTIQMSGSGVQVADDTLAGSHKDISGVSRKITKHSPRVVAAKGVTFGVMFRASGTPEGAVVTVTSRLIHPPMTNPATKATSSSENLPIQTRLGTAQADVFTFEHDWEIVPGKWTQQYYVDGKLLAEKSFNVVTGSGAHPH
jgi:hypothetical protein